MRCRKVMWLMMCLVFCVSCLAVVEPSAGYKQDLRENSLVKMKVVEELIVQGEQTMLEMKQARMMYVLAVAAFKRDEFEVSLDRFTQAETIARVELTAVSWKYLFYSYWWAGMLFLFGISTGTVVILKKMRIVRWNSQIKRLAFEEESLYGLLQETSQKYYKEKKLSPAQFHRTMFTIRRRLATVWRQGEEVQLARAKKHGKRQELLVLEKEVKKVSERLESMQRAHFVEKKLTVVEYEMKAVPCWERLAELEERRIKIEKYEKT